MQDLSPLSQRAEPSASPRQQPTPPVIVAIATTGRPGILTRTLQHMAQLTDRPDRVVLSITCPADIEPAPLAELPFVLDIVEGPKGLSAQRNAAMARTQPDDTLLFLDDDFIICEGFLRATSDLFAQNPQVVVATGTVRKDGIIGPGLNHSDAEPWLTTPLPQSDTLSPVFNAYGCNMALRMAPVHANGLKFDTRLPFYSWLEDVDFSRQLARHGQVVKSHRLQGVHLGTKTGRSRGVPLGYSQIANPIYLCRKGTMRWSHALKLMGRNIAANTLRTPRPEAWVDRAGRLRGNLTALRDLVLGRLAPERVIGL